MSSGTAKIVKSPVAACPAYPGRAREPDRDDRGAPTSHQTGARRSPVEAPEERQQHQRDDEQQQADLGDVTEARVQDVVDDGPLDRVADARAGRVRTLQHHRRDRRDREDDPADPDRAAGRAAPRSCRAR